ncbi:copper chaperone PCu(A)C [Actinomadura madurae]|uniref:copper chaperone PCu(A)C n=1 Tax=Actinomadura madurae TaxID=1993 RepID=UPI00202645B3|nr:copper chaperone PCu(A)C [Actinomadura madurae]URM96534.1 copper chaperone PCu(A)C [Actinomadura madurae]
MRRPAAAAAVLASATVLAACSSSNASSSPDASSPDEAAQGRPRLSVSGAYVPEPPLADLAAGYLTIANTGTKADRLTSVTSDIAAEVAMHRTTSDGAMKHEKELPVPAAGRLTLRVGGLHLMLMDLKRRPRTGDTVTFVLRFAASAPITVKAPVKPATYRPDQ